MAKAKIKYSMEKQHLQNNFGVRSNYTVST